MHDSEILSLLDDDESNENISTRDALKQGPGRRTAQKSYSRGGMEPNEGCRYTRTSAEEVKSMKKYWQIDWGNSQVQAQEERLRPTLYAQGSGRSTRIPTSCDDTSRRIANSADLESNRQTAHLRIHHDTNCSNTRLFNGFQVSVLKRPATNRRDTHPD